MKNSSTGPKRAAFGGISKAYSLYIVAGSVGEFIDAFKALMCQS